MTALLLLALAQPADKLVRLSFDPPHAKPGQTVTLTLTVVVPPGFHTYPTRQPEPAAAACVTRVKFPAPGPVVFVDGLLDPKTFTAKPDPDLGVKELRTLTGTVTFTRKLVVNPAQPPGPVTLTLPELRLPLCTADGCQPPEVLKPSGTLTVLPGAVPVEARYADAVKKALAGL